MTKTYRELTGKEKRQIKKLVASKCANYDKEYGCLPLDCECYMFGVCYSCSGLCKWFRKALLPTVPELQAVFEPISCRTIAPISFSRVLIATLILWAQIFSRRAFLRLQTSSVSLRVSICSAILATAR